MAMVLGDNNSRRLAVAYRIGGVLCVLAAAQVASAADGQPPLKAIAAIVLTPADIRSVTNEPNVRGSGLFTTARTASLVPKCGVGTGTGGGARSQYVAQDLSKPTKPAFGIGSIVLVEPSVGAAASDLTAFHRAGFPLLLSGRSATRKTDADHVTEAVATEDRCDVRLARRLEVSDCRPRSALLRLLDLLGWENRRRPVDQLDAPPVSRRLEAAFPLDHARARGGRSGAEGLNSQRIGLIVDPVFRSLG